MALRAWLFTFNALLLLLSQRKSVHKESLTKSEAEKRVRARIEHNAPKQQRRPANPDDTRPKNAASAGSPSAAPSHLKHSASSPTRVSLTYMYMYAHLFDTCYPHELRKTCSSSENSAVSLRNHSPRVFCCFYSPSSTTPSVGLVP